MRTILFAFALLPSAAFASKMKEGPELCKSSGQLKSEAHPEQNYHLSFSVKASVPVQISWINFEGKLEPKTRHMQNGQRWMQESFLNHWWIFTDQSGQCRAIYSAQTLSKMKTITDQEMGLLSSK